ncbi:MAG: DUF5069 domain-containing protein [Verrucomicrobiota bacterium]
MEALTSAFEQPIAVADPPPDEPLGASGEIVRGWPSPYLVHRATGLMHLPRFIAKIRYHQTHGSLPKSYRKNYKRGFDRFLCMHLDVDPAEVEAIVCETGDAPLERDARLLQLFPDDLRAADWNRELIHKGTSEAGREFILENLQKMGVPHLASQILNICDLIDLDEGRIPGYTPSQSA